MFEGPLVERWDKWMNVDLNVSKEKSKSTYGWNSIKEFEHNKDESKRWKVDKKTNGLWKGQRWGKGGESLHNTTYSFACLGLNLDEDNGVPSGMKGMGPFKEGHHLNKGGMKVKQLLERVHVTNAQHKAPANH